MRAHAQTRQVASPWSVDGRRNRTNAALATALVLTIVACRGDAVARDRTDGGNEDAHETLVVGFVATTQETGHAARRGAQLGAEEAARTGALLGHAFELRAAEADDPEAAVRAARALLDNGAHVLVGGFDDSTCAALAALADARDVVYVNVGCRADWLRANPNPRTFHVEASDAMYLGTMGSGGAAPVLWHGALTRYGAAQLNDRFTRRFGQPADAAAWASWMAMKVLWQASVNPGQGGIDDLAGRLETAEFDGHKGAALRFDASSHQLLQPLFPAATAGPVARVRGSDLPLGMAPSEERAALRRAFDAGAALIVVSNEGTADVSIVRATDRQRLATIPFAERPRGIRVDPSGRIAWVALSDEAPNEEGDGDAVAAIDLRDGRLIARHRAGSDPEQFAVSADGRTLVAANEDAGTATISDLDDGRVRSTATLVVGIEPEGVAISPDGKWAYVTAETSNTVSVIDLTVRAVVSSFLVGERPRAVAFSPDGARAYVSNEISGTLSVVDVPRHAVVGTIVLAEGRARPVGIAVSSDSRTVYVANGRANSVSVVDAATGRELATVPTGRRPWGVALSSDGRWLYTANGGSDDISVMDTRARRVVYTIPAGGRPWGVAVSR